MKLFLGEGACMARVYGLGLRAIHLISKNCSLLSPS